MEGRWEVAAMMEGGEENGIRRGVGEWEEKNRRQEEKTGEGRGEDGWRKEDRRRGQ